MGLFLLKPPCHHQGKMKAGTFIQKLKHSLKAAFWLSSKFMFRDLSSTTQDDMARDGIATVG